MKEGQNLIVGAHLGVVLKHASEEVDIRVWCGFEDETGVGGWRVEARAMGEEE